MNHPGEIARLAAMTRPTIALVNNAQREHQEFMVSVEAVACENGAVLEALPDHGTAVFPHGDAFTVLWKTMADARGARRCLSFGESTQADISLAGAVWQGGGWQIDVRTPLGSFQANLCIAGRHNVLNALAAAACALAAGVSLQHIAEGLSGFEPVKGRSKATELQLAHGRSLTLVDDTYNANPDSVRAAIDVLAGLPGPRLLVLGDMGEVGDSGPSFHAEVGVYARERGIESLYALGEEALHSVTAFGGVGTGRHFGDIDALGVAVRDRLPDVRSMLVKGSRFMKMERVVQSVIALAKAEIQEQGEAGHAA